MNMVGLPLEEFITEWHRRWPRGLVRTYMARGEAKMPSAKLAKTLKTAVITGKVTQAGLVATLRAVGQESVEPFRNRPDYGERKKRLDWLSAEISKG